MKLKEFELVKLEMSGFRHVGRNKATYLFGKNTLIEGGNFKGKTSIMEAICYTQFGCNRLGSLRENVPFLNTHYPKMKLDLTIRTGDELHLFTKRCSEQSKSLKFDENPKTQEYIDELIDKEVFLCQFSPEYFLKLEEDKQRELLLRLLPPISDEAVFNRLSPFSKDILEGINVGDIPFHQKKLRAEKEKAETLILKTQGKMEALDLNIVIPDEIPFDTKNLQVLREQVQTLQSSKIDTSAVEKELSMLRKELSDLPKLYQVKSTRELSAAKNALLDTYKAKTALIKKVAFKSDDQCPTCSQKISEHSIKKLQQEALKHNEPIHKEIGQIVEQGNLLKKQINDLIFENEKTEKKLKDERLRVSKEIQQLEEKLKPEKNIHIDHQLSLLTSRIFELEQRQISCTKLNTKRQFLIDTKKNNETLHEQYLSEIETLKKDVIAIKDKLNALKDFAAQRSKVIAEMISQHLDKVCIVLQKVVSSTGELQDCFEFTYDGKAKRCLSYSELIRAGIEIGDLIRRITGTNYPLFIDNGESITHFNSIAKQVIFSTVVRRKKLTVTTLDENFNWNESESLEEPAEELVNMFEPNEQIPA